MKELNIIKIGGNIIDDPSRLKNFLQDLTSIKGAKILVHGGGKIATETAEKLGIATKMIDGKRITDGEMLKVATMVYAGLINKTVVAQLQSFGCNAIGLSGADANIIPANKRVVGDIDYGFVGDIAGRKINSSFIQLFIKNGLTPVICAITHDEKGNLLNTNADSIASELAVAMSDHYSVKLSYCFEKKGVLKDIDDEDSLINHITEKEYEFLKKDQVISKGMIPKMDNAFIAINRGVKEVTIGQAEHLKNLLNKTENAGTKLSL